MTLPNDYEPLTARLRGVPREDWSFADREEEIAALDRRIETNTLRMEAFRWLSDVCEPLAAKFPEMPVKELVELLPEPERTMARDIVNPPAKRLGDLPVERKNRKPWHQRVERALVETTARPRFSIHEVLEVAGIKRTDTVWSDAHAYAKRILDATCT